MAVMRDMIPALELFQPADVEDALALLDRYGEDGWVLSGGLDTFDWLKDRVKRPEALIDLGGIGELHGITETADGGIRIGAMTTLAEVAASRPIRERFRLLAEAAGKVATPQIRHQGTLGGNLCQDTRCWYYRSGWPCYRAGGNVCYAATPQSMNREHCILGASRCVAINPSDTAPALIALDARMSVRNRGGEREVPAQDFFVGPEIDIERMTVLEPGDLLTSIRIPATMADAAFYFEKVQDRQSWDFSLASVAAAVRKEGETIRSIRLAVNGVAPTPLRLEAVERAVTGRAANDETGLQGGTLAVEGAKPLRHNDYKVALMRNLVRRAIRDAEA